MNNIEKLQEDGPLIKNKRYVIKRDKEKFEDELLLIKESELKIYVNNEKTFSMSCINDDIDKLTVGKIYISYDTQKVKNIKTDKEECSVYVDISTESTKRNLEYKDRQYSVENVFKLADRFKEGMELHRQTYMTHCCIVMYRDEIVYLSEDINRYNVLYKAVGFMVMNNIDPYDCIIYFSGRVDDKVIKLANKAHIGVFVSKSSVTANAAKYARNKNMTLICSARPDSICVYSGSIPE